MLDDELLHYFRCDDEREIDIIKCLKPIEQIVET
jgi:hypothetical protein